ncbi:30S ribosomal protein bS22 [Klenkia sesuvii]|uniref:30S ribosomal protein bS22 n=1 Tax=Klenkia sesuvii TaxID=3103137 RepID=UPI003D77C4EC
MPGLTSGRRPGPARPRVGSITMGSVIKKRRKRMAKKKHRKLLKKTRVQRRNKK